MPLAKFCYQQPTGRFEAHKHAIFSDSDYASEKFMHYSITKNIDIYELKNSSRYFVFHCQKLIAIVGGAGGGRIFELYGEKMNYDKGFFKDVKYLHPKIGEITQEHQWFFINGKKASRYVGGESFLTWLKRCFDNRKIVEAAPVYIEYDPEITSIELAIVFRYVWEGQTSSA
ncbi:hypothetical protein [Catenovulum maritimum]|uniref:Uncharacterized protein n=1 Tax=Catenovulum maritimum TaxID=1513271 RepID=A0A0J8JKW2_9ALTE|nr:hypothetical protein [Catenovulum maritimum]KMT65161.1 hypothetical protein XM47_10515 [Catenovulum maritimum]